MAATENGDGAPICVRCGAPVVARREHYDLFERMHWICFHFEYEHDADPDEACGDVSCPMFQNALMEEKLRSLGSSWDVVLGEHIQSQADPPPSHGHE